MNVTCSQPILIELLMLLGVCATSVACQKQETSSHARETDASASAPGERVLARVNGAPITARDAEFGAKQTLGALGDAMLASERRDLVVKGLVVRKAMASLQEEQLDERARADIDRQVQAHRERLLAKRFIDRKLGKLSVSLEQARGYYAKHPERFGAREQLDLDVLEIALGSEGAVRGQRIAALAKTSTQRDWAEAAGSHDWMYVRTGLSSTAGLPQKFARSVNALSEGKVSGVVMLGERAYVARLNSRTKRPARPFEQVRGEIEEILHPTVYRDAVRALEKEVLDEVEVTYPTPSKSARERTR